ncbi:hypothetical protein LTR95_004585 [Oleoguttula sp. CCFEE 5521]
MSLCRDHYASRKPAMPSQYRPSSPSPPPPPSGKARPGQPASAKFYELPILPPGVPEMSGEDAVNGIMKFGNGIRMPPSHHTGQPLEPEARTVGERHEQTGLGNLRVVDSLPPPGPTLKRKPAFGREDPEGVGTGTGMEDDDIAVEFPLEPVTLFGRGDEERSSSFIPAMDAPTNIDIMSPTTQRPGSGFASSSAGLPQKSIESDAISPTKPHPSALRNAFANRGTQERAADHGVQVRVTEVDPSTEHVEDVAALQDPGEEEVGMADAPSPFQDMVGQKSNFPTQRYGQARPPTRLMSDPTDIDGDMPMLEPVPKSHGSREAMSRKTAFRPQSRGKAPSSTGLLNSPANVNDDMPILQRFPRPSSSSRPPSRGKTTGPFVFTEQDLDDLIPDHTVTEIIDGLAEAWAEDTSMTDAPSMPPSRPRPGHRQLPANPFTLSPAQQWRHDAKAGLESLGPPPMDYFEKLMDRLPRSQDDSALPGRSIAKRSPTRLPNRQPPRPSLNGVSTQPASPSSLRKVSNATSPERTRQVPPPPFRGSNDRILPSPREPFALSLPKVLAKRRATQQGEDEAEEEAWEEAAETAAERAWAAPQKALSEAKAFERSHRVLEWRIQGRFLWYKIATSIDPYSASHIAHLKAFRRAIRKFWDTNQREDIQYTALALWIDGEPTPTMGKYVWGSDVTANVHLLFYVTDSSDLAGEFRKPRKVYGQVLGEGWDEAVATYWRERERDVERRRRYRALKKEYPDLDLSFYLSSRKDSLCMLAEGAEEEAEKMGKEVYVVAADDEGWSSSEDENEEKGKEEGEEGSKELNDPALQEAIRRSLST